MQKVFDVVIFDLDGTLAKTGDGIIESLLQCLKQIEFDIPDKKILRKFIGPPIETALMDICGLDQEQSKMVTKIYRNHYEEFSWKKNTLYPGIQNLLQDLKKANVFLTTATSRPKKSAVKTMKYLKIYDYFDTIVAEKEEQPKTPKKDLINMAIATYTEKYGNRLFNPVMVGDTHFDIIGAKQSNVTSIAVSYGYGTLEELEEQKPDMIAKNVPELKGYLLK